MQIGVEANRAVENRRIFVIDNDDVSGIALQFMLADDNETHVFESVAAALDKAATASPDLVLLGTGILASQGASIVARIKNLLAPVKVLLIAEGEDDPQIAAGRNQGADNVIQKPLKLELVRRKVDLALGRRVDLGIAVV